LREAGAVPETRYARSGDLSIAYQVLGDGPLDLVLAPGWPSHLEHGWEQPRLAHFYRRLAAFSRLILFDKRGVGLSDRVPPSDLPGIERRMDDLRAVLDAVGSGHAAILGISDGGPNALMFAATYPDRTDAVVLLNSYSRRLRSPDYPWGPSSEDWDGIIATIDTAWGQPLFLETLFPSMVDDAQFATWWSALLRRSSSPTSAIAYLRMNALIDVRAVLPAVHVPTLVLHRAGDAICPVEGGRFMAERVPGARFVELPGADHQPWVGDVEPVLRELEEFLTGGRASRVSRSVLGTLLFTDIVSSTQTAAALGDEGWSALLETHNTVVQTQLMHYQGREVNTTGDGFVALFDGPARAVRCALAIADALAPLGVRIRAGVHTSEIELANGDVRGLGVHVAARILAQAGPGEVVVSSVVRDLALGSGLSFADRGRHTLKGVPGEWGLLTVQPDGG
jgi:pimeloyl-ACP methyl ester carboxylesterase